jgi:hypothetical protein
MIALSEVMPLLGLDRRTRALLTRLPILLSFLSRARPADPIRALACLTALDRFAPLRSARWLSYPYITSDAEEARR